MKTKEPKKVVQKPVNINLYDVLPIFKPSKATSNDKREDIAEFVALEKSIIDLENNLNEYFTTEKTNQIVKEAVVAQRLVEKLIELRKDFLSKHNYLPDEMLHTVALNESNRYHYSSILLKKQSDNITKISKSSKIMGSDVKNITDKFGFITIPLECLNEKSYENEEWYRKKEIVNFGKNVSDYNVYVITPIEYYSLENHVYKNTKEKGIYAGNHGMIFTSVVINIPMFRSMLNTIANIKDGVDKLQTENINIKQSILQIDNTLKNLQRQVDIQQKQMIQQQLVIQQQTEALQRFEQMALRIIDPVMIAFDKNVDINSAEFDQTCCFVGPCWGPDFDEAVSLALDLKIIKNQRSSLTKSSSELWN